MFAAVFTILNGIAMTSALATETGTDPHQMVDAVMTKTFARIREEQATQQPDNRVLERIVLQELMPHVDHAYFGLSVLGNHAKGTDREVLAEYLEVFKSYLVGSYASALEYYQQQEVVLLPPRDVTDQNAVAIKALVKEQGKPDIQLVFKVRRNKSGQWKAYDMVVEGVSLLQSKRAEFATLLRKDGVPALTTLLQSRSGQTEAGTLE